MNLIDRREMVAAKMIVAVLFCSGVCQTAAAYQMNVFTTGNNQFLGDATDLHHFDGSGPQEIRWDIADTKGGISIATDNSSLFVAESSGAINRYDRQGNFLGEYADVSAIAGLSPSNQRIESDSVGNIYSVFGGLDSTARTSFRLDPAGTVSATFAHPDLVFPRGIDANANGDVFILNGARKGVGNRLFKFDATGKYLDNFELPSVVDPSDIAINESTNELFVSDEKAKSIFIYDLASGSPVLTHTLPVLGRAIDVFVEQTSGRVFGTMFGAGQDDKGLFINANGFEVSRDGSLVNTYTEDADPRYQTVYGIVAIPVH